MLEGKFERRFDFLLVVAHPAGRQNLKAKTRLLDLPDYFRHRKRVGGEERIAYRERDDRRHLRQFLRRAGQVVEARHE